MKNIKTSVFFRKGRFLLSLLLSLVMAAQAALPGAVVFAADGTTTLSKYCKGTDGRNYRVTASYGADAGIPADAQLSVSSIAENSADYDGYVRQAALALHCVIDSAEEIRLFDISLVSADGATEYQPAEGATVEMKVRLAAAPETDLGVVHFGEEAERLDSEVDGRTVAFAATGFSVYAFVDIQGVDNVIHNVADFGEGSVYLSVTTTKGNTYFLAAGTNPGSSNTGQVYNRTEANRMEGAAAYCFEKLDGTEDRFYMYLPGENGAKQYVDLSNPTKALYASSPATVFTILPCGDQYPDQFYLSFQNGSTTYYLNLRRDENGKGFNGSTWGPPPQSSVGSNFTAYRHLPSDADQLDMDGKTYGIARTPVRNIAAVLSANQKSENVLAAEALPVRANPLASGEDTILKVGGDVDLFTFHLCGDNLYYITTQAGGATKYLSLQSGGTRLLDAPDDYSTFKVTAGYGDYNGMLKIICDKTGHSLSQSGNAEAGFISKNSNSINEYFYLIEKEEIETEDYVSYTATKVSVSDVRNHTKVIVYTRIWNEETKRYEIYAIDHDGSLVYCYNEGETIRWAGTQINTLLWDFTVYYYWLTFIPNHYYELQNTYSGKYIAPQYHTGQVLSDRKIGINLPGRRYDEYYSTILAWDDSRYDYAGLKPGDDGFVTAVPMAQAQDFYFAVLDTPTPDEFSTVDTVDNAEHGIRMKMINFQGEKYGTNNGAGGRDRIQTNVMGEGTDSFTGGKIPVLDLVTTDLKDNGYPDATHTNKSLEELFGGATDVNHLFLKSTYEESGYFEYDCTQNFATLLDSGNFRVYNQLGTAEVNTNSQGHGWFLPFNDIDPSLISTYTNITDVHNDPLASNNPRLGEQLYSVPYRDTQYHFGMEMEASFIQSKSGLDAWGHDIIFEFAGDDDMWLYVDGQLVLDLGGVHSAVVGKINFRTGEVILPDETGTVITTNLRNIFRDNYKTQNPKADGVSEEAYNASVEAYLDTIFKPGDTVFKDYSSHTMKMLYMERGAGASNLHMRFNLTTAVDGQLLLSKTVSGTDKQDYASARFPYQIWYLDKKGGVEEWKTVTRTGTEDSYTYTGVTSVNYQGKSIPVEYEASYEGYDNVFFLKPGEVAEIQFPDDTTVYYIKECRVDTRIYDRVTVNDEEVTTDRAEGYFHDYSSQQEVIGERKVVQFDNHVSPNALRTLSITKNLYDVENRRVNYPDDPTGFRFRVYIGDTLDYYRMDSYYVKDNNDYYCRFDADQQKFISVGVKNFEQLTMEQLSSCTFTTSPSGAIDKIPIDFTVEIRNLLIDTKFKVEEQESDIPKGYDLIGYDRADASYIVEDGDELNVGVIRDNASPHLIVNNHRGWGLTVEKVWTDDSFMQTHDNIYFAVYYNDAPVEGTVRRMRTDKEAVIDEESGELIGYDFETSLYYYFKELLPGAKFADYTIREVALTDPVVNEETGYVTSYGTITPLGEGAPLAIGGVPSQTGVRGEFSYTVTYDVGTPGGPANNVRTDTVTNARPGVRLMKVDANGDPLPGATFTLKDGDGNDVTQAEYVSGSDGVITYAYPEQNVTYTLTETAAPDGYSALIGALTFTMVGEELTVSSDNDSAVTVLPRDADGMITVRIKNDRTRFSAVKADAYNDEPIKDVHFALYRQVIGTNGPRKDYYPLIGYSDLVTGDDGVIPQIDTSLPAGTYYLCETQTPREYLPLESDIVFTVSKTGTITVEGENADMLTVAVNENSELVYTLKIPNRRSFKTISLSPQTLIADFGLNIRYDVTDNNYLVPENSAYTYIGLCAKEDYDAYGTEAAPALIGEVGTSFKGQYGTVTLSANGEAVYEIGSMQFAGEDEFYLVAHVTKISGTAADVYVYEKLTYLPATTIYYEDDFASDDNYHDGVESTATGYNFGKWSRVTSGDPATEQAADLANNASANIFGYDPHYTDCATYSNNGSHKVAVGDVNSGNDNKNWPYMEFDFAGTGFDLVSVTGCDTGLFVVEVYKTSVNEAGETVVGARANRQTVNTYYGYEYGKLYLDANGAATLTNTGRPLYEATQEIIDEAAATSLLRISGRMLTPRTTYYDTQGDITETPHYYDKLGNVTETVYYINKNTKAADSVTDTIPEGESDNYEPNYASAEAEGWLVSGSADKSLYQIPVLKVRDLEYGTYRAHIEARFTARYGHYKTVDGYNYFDLYVDAFRIYNPAGNGDDGTLTSTVIDEAYNYSSEAFEKFTTLKKVVIGAETMGNYTADDEAVEGSVVVDGNMPLDTTRLNEYKAFGPNNELYLSKNMSVAFEICATMVPADVQVQLKKISAAIPTLRITYLDSKGKVYTNDVEVRSATDLSYSILSMIGRDNITWTKLKAAVSGAEEAWSSGLVIVSNVGEAESLISVTNLKWTFRQAGEGLKIHDSDYKVSVTNRNIGSIKKVMAFSRKSMAIAESTPATAVYEDGRITMTVVTDTSVTALTVRDKDGNTVDDSVLEAAFKDLNDTERLWTVTVEEGEDGDYTFYVSGENDGLVSGKTVTVTVNVENAPPEEDLPDDGGDTDDSQFGSLIGRFRSLWLRFIELLWKILGMLGVKRA